MSDLQLTFDIFCDVIDNYGDAGVCLHLARDLSAQENAYVRLFCNDMSILDTLVTKEDRLNPNLECVSWKEPPLSYCPSKIVISAFNCRFDATTLKALQEAMKTQDKPLIVNLEYLSAEDWVESSHKLVSFVDGLEVYYFFPGFTPRTGGLNISKPFKQEALANIRNNFTAFNTLSLKKELLVSVFTYKNPVLKDIFHLEAVGENNAAKHNKFGDTKLKLQVFEGLPLANINELTSLNLEVGSAVDVLPITLLGSAMVPHNQYDEILLKSDLNLVRGEDSIVRAMHVGNPFLWQIYVQEDDVHIEKIQAFLDRVDEILTEEYAPFLKDNEQARQLYIPLEMADLKDRLKVFCDIMLQYNGKGTLDSNFDLLKYIDYTRPIYHNLALYLCLQDGLSERLLDFISEKLAH